MGRVVLWDFDGTLAERPGLWSQALVDVLDAEDPGHGIVRETLRAALRDGFPWHRADDPHPHLSDPDVWWGELLPVFAAAYASAGYDDGRTEAFARRVRERFLDVASWRVFEDAEPALEDLTTAGWSHIIVSNHVPELADLVDGLGLGSYFDAVVTSALVGFDKPHPGIFEHAIELADGPEQVWMVGDSPAADIAGAERLGIPAILVRTDAEAARRATDLREAAGLIADVST
jgi:putative hydrolase of the HAD superfamily